MATKVVKAGWYTHPENKALLRYWDGVAWVDEAQPPQQPSPDLIAIRRDVRSIKVFCLLLMLNLLVGIPFVIYGR